MFSIFGCSDIKVYTYNNTIHISVQKFIKKKKKHCKMNICNETRQVLILHENNAVVERDPNKITEVKTQYDD